MLNIPIQKYFLNDQEVVCRLYDLETDPEKIILTLYTALQSSAGIAELREQDREYFLNSKKNFRLVAEIDNILASSVVLMNDEDFEQTFTCELYSVVTNEKYMGSGISTIMINYAFEVIRFLGGKNVRVWTDFDNFRAQKFYSKMGFKEVNRTDKAVYYILKLK